MIKIFDKIAMVSFWMTILFIPISFIMMPLFSKIAPDVTSSLFTGETQPYFIFFLLFIFSIFYLLGYCFLFWYNNDKYSNAIFLLIAFTGVYAPIYYYRVKIKKRPLMNKPKTKKSRQSDIVDNSITDSEFIELTRKNILDLLGLWASREEQIKYQKDTINIQVSKELFSQWNDFYTLESDVLIEAFNNKELLLLKEFDKELSNHSNNKDFEYTDINKFIETEEWKALNSMAKRILIEMK